MKKSILFLALVAGAFSLQVEAFWSARLTPYRASWAYCNPGSKLNLKYYGNNSICACTVNKNGANYALSCDLALRAYPKTKSSLKAL